MVGALVLSALVLGCSAVCPTIKDYNGRPPNREVAYDGAWPRLVIRGGKGYTCTSVSSCPDAIRQLQATDMKSGCDSQTGGGCYPDIDCSFVVGGDGYVYEGRGWGIETSEFSDSMVICVLENTNSGVVPDTFQEQALNELIGCAVDNGDLTSSYIVQTPRDIIPGSDDPIQSLYDWVKKLDHYSSETNTLG